MVACYLDICSLRQAYRPDDRANRTCDVVAVPGDPDHAVMALGDGRGGTMLPAERAQVQHGPIRRPEKRPGDREAPRVGPTSLAHAHDAAELGDGIRAAGPSAESTEIEHAVLFRPQKRMTASAHDLGPIVDAQRDAGARAQRTEIPHAVDRSPENCVRLSGPRLRQAHHRALVVHVVRDARGPGSPKAAHVDHGAGLRDHERMFRHRSTEPTVPRHLPPAIHGERLALVPSQRAEVEARALGQEVGMKVAEACVPATNDLAVLVDVVGRGVHTGERFQVYDSQILLPEERPGATQAVATRAHHLASPVHRLRLAHRAPQRAKLAHRNYRRPSCLLAHRPAWTAVSAVGPSKRCTRMAARPLRLTATMWKIET